MPPTNRRRAGILNLASVLLDQAVSLTASVLITPVIVNSLGTVMYGFWQFAQRFIGQIAMLDGRGSESLKYKLARSNSLDVPAERQKAVGAAVFTLGVFLLVPIGLAAAVIANLEHIPAATAIDRSTGAIVLIILCFTMVVGSLSTILEAVLRGMNQGYRRMGLRASIVIAGTSLNALVLMNGGGVISLAKVTALTALVTLVSLVLLVRRTFTWFRPTWPTLAEMPSVIRQSCGFTLWGFVGTAVATGDMLVIGFLLSSEEVTNYSLTKFLPQYAPVLAYNFYSAMLPGFAGKIGEGRVDQAFEIHRKAGSLGRSIGTIVCCCLLVVNEWFVSIWIGNGSYLGFLVNYLICIITYQTIALNQENAFLNILLEVRSRIIDGGVSLGMLLVMGLVLTPSFGVAGLCMSVVVSRIFLMARTPLVLRRATGLKSPGRVQWNASQYSPLLIITITAVIVFALPRAFTTGTVTTALALCVTVVFSALLSVALVLESGTRRLILNRIGSKLGGFGT